MHLLRPHRQPLEHPEQHTGSLVTNASLTQQATLHGPRPLRTGQVQHRYVPLQAVLEGDTLCVGHPGPARRTGGTPEQTYCAVLAVNSLNFTLRSAEEQEAIIASFAAWLNALSFDVQIVVRVVPLSLEPYLRRPLRSLHALRAALSADARAPGSALDAGTHLSGFSHITTTGTTTGAGALIPQQTPAPETGEQSQTRTAWVGLIEDHVEFVRQLARQRRLLDRHFYLVIPADGAAGLRPRAGFVSWLARLRQSARPRQPGILRGERHAVPDVAGHAAHTWQRQHAARHQLDLRVLEVTRQVGRMGLSARRLHGQELVQLYYSCLTPHRAARHPLSAQVLASADVPVVAAAARVRAGARATGGDPAATQTETHPIPAPPDALNHATRHAQEGPPAAGAVDNCFKAAPSAGLEAGRTRDAARMDALDTPASVAASASALALPPQAHEPSVPTVHNSRATTSRRFVTVASDAAGERPSNLAPTDHSSHDRRRQSTRAGQHSAPPETPTDARSSTDGARLEAASGEDLCAGLAALLAPASVELARDHLCLEEEYARALVVTGYPRHVYPGWLSHLIDADVPLEVVMHIHPRDARAAILRLRRRMVEFQSSRLLDQKAGKLPDTEREIAFRDIEHLQEQLQRGDTRVFDLSLYLLVRGPSLTLLDQRTEQLHMALDTLMLVGRPALYEQDVAFTSCLPEAQDRLRRSRLLDTGSVATAFPFSSSTLSMHEGILYGTVPRNGSLIILDPFSSELENANAVVFAQSGAGKSYACKLQALRSLASGIAVTIVDPEDEYRRLCQAVGGQYIRLSPSSSQRLNPFDLFVPSTTLTAGTEQTSMPGMSPHPRADDGEWDPLAEKVQALHTLLDLMLADHGPGQPGSLTQREKGLLDRALYETYRQAGITPDPTTHLRPAPLLRDLERVLRSEAYREQDTSGLADRLHRWVEGSLARMFSAPTNVRMDSPFVVFNIRDMDAELKPIGLALITDAVWTRMRRERSRVPRLLFIDEAWTLMQFPEGGRFLSALARRARKYYLGLVTITQDVQDFLQSEWGQTVLAQSAMKLLMKQDASTIDAVSRVFRLSQGERQFVLGCNKGEGLLFARGAHVALRIEASPKEHLLATTNPRELAALEARETRTTSTDARADGMAPHPDVQPSSRESSQAHLPGRNGRHRGARRATLAPLDDLPAVGIDDPPAE